MNWLSSVMGILSSVLQVYMLLLVIRIVLTWVSMDRSLPMVRALGAVTDPYLNWFRRFGFLRWGNLDFSPVAALLVINFLGSFAYRISVYGEITVGIILAIIVTLVWSAAAFFAAIFTIAPIVRLLAIRFRWGGAGLWSFVDSVLQPPAYGLGRMIRPKAFVSYPTALAVLTVVNAILWIGGTVLFDFLGGLLVKLPV